MGQSELVRGGGALGIIQFIHGWNAMELFTLTVAARVLVLLAQGCDVLALCWWKCESSLLRLGYGHLLT